MKYKEMMVKSLHEDEFRLISEAEALKFCNQNHMADFVSNFDFEIMDLYFYDNDRKDPFRLLLQYDLLTFVCRLNEDKKELLNIINSVAAYEIIGIHAQLIRLKDLLKCVSDLLKNDQIVEPNDLFAGFCVYYDYTEFLYINKDIEENENKE